MLFRSDDILVEAWGASGAAALRGAARSSSGPDSWRGLLRGAQRTVERRLRAARRALVVSSNERRERLSGLGCDPLLDFLDDE